MKKKSLKVKSGYIYNTTYPGEETERQAGKQKT